MNEMTISDKFLREWQKRMDAAEIEALRVTVDKLRQEYLTRTERDRMKP